MDDAPAPMSTREAEWQRIAATTKDEELRLSLWAQTPVLAKVSQAEWDRDHTGTCGTCGAPARFYPLGWACEDHKPGGAHDDGPR
jgi:hypothetical protein